ncbi:MFS transporter [Chryseobacterium indologenes]|uniref:MFS transporter n=1 Tax=Chryseobacterium indologenes TaxID=253 RepID=UPI0003E05F0B|nr:MFS transporter [Chryseobacterium indologenes]QPQ51066.1 MFS transporter [Chryseobacterium indologenes]TLX25359.1 MFS transporter [Chryseobacterium indologenes]SFK05218.1 MFS transporter, YNFM family, putative membrane transport protein [Chryseobacterium indologenes]SUX49423.1 Inner membrane transport protein ynfM [Chryseobacterium indologenes]GAE65773.1 putative major facilitator superfamily transporter [Chryseobacterium indologenes NBRC 14944]
MNVPEKADQGSRRFRNIKLCIFFSGLSVFAQLYLFQPMLPMAADYFKVSVGDTSLLVSSSTIGMASGLLFFAFRADSYSRKALMTFSLISSALLTIISTWVPSLSLLIAIGIFKGFVVSGVSAVALAYLTEEVHAAVIGSAISMYLSGNTIGGMSGRILATLLAGEFGWRNAVLLIGIESLILGLIFWKLFPDSKFFNPQKTDYHLKVKQMKFFLTNPYMLRLYLIAALLMGVFVSVYNYLTFRLEEKPFSLSHFIIAFIFLMYIFGVFGTMIVGKLSKRFPMNTILKGSILFMLAGAMLLLSENIYILIFGLGLFTLSFFAAHTMASQMTALYAKRGKSSATSIYWLFYYFGSSILGSGTGYLLHAYSWNVFIAVLVCSVAIALVLATANTGLQQKRVS